MPKPSRLEGGAPRLNTMKFKMNQAILLLIALLAGCVFDSELLRTDNTLVVQQMAQKRAVADLKCKDVIADRPIRRDRVKNMPGELYSEYIAWGEGCGRQVTYLIVCQESNVCTFADQEPPPAN